MEWVLGLDGGGTKTLLALANRQGQVLGPLAAEGINPFDNPAWKNNLHQLIGQCPRPLTDLARATFGMPGYGEVPAVSAEQEQLARQFVSCQHSVLNDVHIAFIGALAGQAGVLTLGGTGSMAWAGAGNKQVRVGGWGDGFGDEGSAFWIGQQALSDLSKALDGRIPDPDFAAAMLEVIGARDVTGLLEWYYSLKHSRSQVAGLAKSVDGLAEIGNPTAIRLLNRAATELALLAQTAYRLLGDPSAGCFSYAGGVFNSRTLRESVSEAITPLGQWQSPLASPVAGALLHAARQAAWAIDSTWIASVQKGLQGALA